MKLTFQFATAILAPLLVTAPIRAAMQASEHPLLVPELHISLVDRDSDTAVVGSESTKGFTVQVTDQSGAPAAESAVVFRLPDEGASGTFADAAHSAIVYTAADGRARIAGIKWSDTPGSVAIKVTATKGDARAGFLLIETLTPKAAAVTASNAHSGPAAPGKTGDAALVNVPAVAPVASPGQPGTARDNAALPRTSVAPQQPSAEPVVSVVNGKTADSMSHHSYKKWIILAAVVAAAAGAGLALGGKSKSTSSSTSSTGVSVGTPSISVGQP